MRREASEKQSARWLLALTVLAIALATLVPTPDATKTSGPCLLCGGRGVADALLNVLLFVPFGAALALRGYSTRRVVVAGLLFSAAIELLQFAIPGRDSTIGDVVFNALGAGIGSNAIAWAPQWIFPTQRRARRLAATAAAIALVTLIALTQLLKPAIPHIGLYGQWTPEFDNLEHYGGTVIDARIGDIAAPSRLIPQSEKVREYLLSGVPLTVHAIAGPAPRGLAPIFNFYDDRQREIVLLGADGVDAVFRYRTWSTAVRLDQPQLRIRGALADVPPNAPLRIEMFRVRRGYCVILNEMRACPIGFTVGRSWSELFAFDTKSGTLERALDFFWLFVLFAPTGFWLTGRKEWVLCALLVTTALALIPVWSRLLPTSVAQLSAAPAGLLMGVFCRRLVQVWLIKRSRSTSASDRAETSPSRQRSMRE
jgi:VanZ family protein